jgi:copper chaperone CopZ
VEWYLEQIESAEDAENARMVLEEMAAVRGVRVSLQSKIATVCFDDSTVGIKDMKKALRKAGFDAILI